MGGGFSYEEAALEREAVAGGLSQQQQKRQRKEAATHQLADLAPVDIAAAVWPGLRRIWKEHSANDGMSSGDRTDQQQQEGQQQEPGGKAGKSSSEVWYKLLMVSGWGEDDSAYAAPVYQAAWAYWLRHKLTPATTSLVPEGEAEVDLLPLSGENASMGAEGGRSLSPSPVAGVGADAPGSGIGWGGVPGGKGGVQGRRVWRTAAGDVLCLKQQMVNSRGQLLGVEVQDICCSRLAAVAAAAEGVRSSATAGAAGVLLLVAGPEVHELSGALSRLRLVLEHMSGAVAVPLAVVTASGGLRVQG